MATTTERLAIIVTADSRQAVTGLQAVGKSASTDIAAAEKSTSRFSEHLGTMGAAASVAGATVSYAMYEAAQSTQSLADSWDKALTTFGKGAQSPLDAFAAKSVDSMAVSSAAALDAASAYGLLLKQANLGGDALVKASTDLAVRTADIAEAYKKPVAEVQKAIESTIKTGSAKSLKNLLGIGIEIDPKQLQGLDTAAKATKIYQEILRQTADVNGTVAKSTDDVGVELDKVRARWENTKASLGEAAAPALTELFNQVNGLLDTFNDLDPSVRKIIGSTVVLAGVTLSLAGPVLQLAGAYQQLAAAKAASAAAGGGGAGISAAAGAAAPIVAVAAVLAGLEYKATEEQAKAADKAAFSIDKLGEAVRSANLDSIAKQAREGQAALEAMADPGIWSRISQGANASLLSGTIGTAASSIFGQVLGNSDAASGQIDAFNAQVEQFKSTLAGLEPDQARAAIAAFIEGLEGGIVPTSELARLQKILNEEYGKAVPPTDETAAYTGALAGAAGAADDLRAILEGAGLSTEQIDAALGAVDKGATTASVSMRDLGGVAKALGVDVDVLAKILSGAGIEVDSFSSRFEKAAAAGRKASSMVLDYERAILRQKSAQETLEGLGAKQAEDQRSANERVSDATDSVTEAIKRRAKAQRDLDALNKKSAIAGSVPLLQEITRFAADQQKAAEAAAQAAEIAYGKDSPQAIAARRGVDSANQRRTQAGGFLNAALGEQTAQNAQQRSDAQDAVASADKDISRASRARADAEREAADVGKNAATERKQAELDLAEATLNTAEAQGRLDAAYRDGLDPVGQFRDQLADAGAKGIISAGQLAELNGMLDNTSGAIQRSSTMFAYLATVAGQIGAALFGQTSGAVPVTAGGVVGAATSAAGNAVRSVTNNYNISAVSPSATASEIERRNKQKILEQKLGR